MSGYARALLLFFLGCTSGLHAEGNSAQAPQSGLIPSRLRCEYRINPLNVDLPSPRFDWILSSSESSARGQHQTAYEILVASSPELLAQNRGDFWDSGKVSSDAMAQISYAGQSLRSDQTYWWKVRAWDEAGSPTAWSTSASWNEGPITPADWKGAQWLGAPGEKAKPDFKGPKSRYETLLLRREFTVKPGLKRALVNVCGLGQYEMSLNGTKVGTDLLTPGWSQYEKTCLYDTYDVTHSLQPGTNAVGVLLGNGMYLSHQGRYHGNATNGYSIAPLQCIAYLHLEYADGSNENLITDDQWRCHPGPITFSSEYGGEDYDARLNPAGWDMPGFDTTAWESPQVGQGPGGSLRGISCAAPPIRAFQSLKPVSQKELKAGVTVYDLGQNAAIMLRVKVSGPAGSVVRVTPDELVHENGQLDRGIFGHQPVWWQYTLDGSGHENYFSKFFYVGARYLQVELIPTEPGGELPKVESMEGVVIHADCPAAGQFSCGNDLLTKTWTLVRWAQQNNMVSTMTDCPTREKRGWLEQDHLNGPALRYNWDMAALFTKVVNDMKDAQCPDGLVPSTCPNYLPDWLQKNRTFADSPEWSSACILVPWQQYEFDGDVELLGRSYAMMQKYQAYLGSKAKDHLVNYGLGDWFDIGPKKPGISQLTPLSLTGTAFYYEDTQLLSKIAHLLGKEDDASEYAQQAEQIRVAFNQALFHADSSQYGVTDKLGSQCSNSLPLVMGLVESSSRQPVLKNIVEDVQTKGLTAGDVGYRYLLRALAEGGRSDVIYSLNNQSDKPGYGYQLKLGKTSLTEGWAGTDSQDHFMLGQINEWFFHDLAGIQGDPLGPGFRKIIIRPAIIRDLGWVKASYDSISGRIVSEWEYTGDRLKMHLSIPANTTATIYVPTSDADSIREGTVLASRSPGLKFVRMDEGNAVYEAGSGNYDFSSTIVKN